VRTYDDFAGSSFYSAFVKFGRYCQEIRCISFLSYLDWLIKNNKSIDYWCKDKLYSEWVLEYAKKENVQDALERGLKEMQRYAEDHPEFENGFRDYFRVGNVNRILFHITTCRISPWILYNCDSGVDFLSNLCQDDIEAILPFILPDFWQQKFEKHREDTEWTKTLLKDAGL
jgi:hypothetical protein